MSPHTINTVDFGSMMGKGFYIPNGSSLVVAVRNVCATSGFTIVVRAMTIDPQGNYNMGERFFKITKTDGSSEDFFFPAMECYLQSIHAYILPPFNLLRGQTFVTISVKLGTVTSDEQVPPLIATLAADYIETAKPVTYPESGVTSSVAGKGFVYTRSITNVLDGAAMGYTVPDNLRQRVIAFRFKYAVTGGGSAQKILFQVLANGGAIKYEVVIGTAIGVGAAARISYISGVNEQSGTFGDTILLEPIPLPTILVAADLVKVLPSTSPQVGDVMSDIRLWIEQWIEPRSSSDPP